MDYLVTVVESWRVPTMEDADALEMEARSDGHFEVSKCGKVHKERKVKGEVVDAWVVVTITKVFNNMKEPDTYVRPEYK